MIISLSLNKSTQTLGWPFLVIIRVTSRFNLGKLSLKITGLSLKVLFRDYGWGNLPNNQEMI